MTVCDSKVRGVTQGCRVAGVQPIPPWNGTRLPREKEMEQEIGLVSLFPSPVSLSNPLQARTHTVRHTLPGPWLIVKGPGTFYMSVCIRATDYRSGPSKPPNTLYSHPSRSQSDEGTGDLLHTLLGLSR